MFLLLSLLCLISKVIKPCRSPLHHVFHRQPNYFSYIQCAPFRLLPFHPNCQWHYPPVSPTPISISSTSLPSHPPHPIIRIRRQSCFQSVSCRRLGPLRFRAIGSSHITLSLQSHTPSSKTRVWCNLFHPAHPNSQSTASASSTTETLDGIPQPPPSVSTETSDVMGELVTFLIVPNRRTEQCPIYMNKFGTYTPAAGPCLHNFHHQCLRKWLTDSATKKCPVCRDDVTAIEENCWPGLGSRLFILILYSNVTLFRVTLCSIYRKADLFVRFSHTPS